MTLSQWINSVSDKTNEIPISTEILKAFDVRGKVITTDALLTQKTFCQEIIEGMAIMCFLSKTTTLTFAMISKNSFKTFLTHFLRTLHILCWETLFTLTRLMKNHMADLRQGVSSASLNAYLDWPCIEQVIQYRYIHKNPNTGEETTKVHYGRTSLTPEEASAERLLTLKRGHWSIENKSHWRRGCCLEKMSRLSDAVLCQKSYSLCEGQHYLYLKWQE